MVDPDRVEAAISAHLAPLELDVLALQEADGECCPHARIFDVAKIEERTGLRSVHVTPALRWGPESDGFLGTILFLRPSLRVTHTDLIDLPGHCHRGAVAVEVEVEARSCRIMSAHLSLTQLLRMTQMRTLGQYLRRRPKRQTIFLGDFNEWRPWGGLMFSERLVGTAFRGPVARTFPSRVPLLPLDRILTDGGGEVQDLQALNDPDIARASDHLALFGIVTLL